MLTIRNFENLLFELIEPGLLSGTTHTIMNQVTAWDSLKHFNIIIELEQHFKIEIRDAEATSLVDVKSIAGLIQNKTGM